MDKYEYRMKTEQMLEYVEQKSYKQAMEIADTIDWRKVKNIQMLMTVSEVYENMDELQKARDILFIAYEKANRDAYHQSIKKCIDHIAAEYARIGISIPATFDYRLFFIFLPLSEVKQIKESVIQWIDSQEPLI